MTEILDITDNISFSYILEKHGWSTLNIINENKIYPIDISHTFSNPLLDLGEFIADLDNGSPTSQVIFYSEPNGTIMTYSLLKDRHDLCVFELKELNSDFGDALEIGETIISVSLKIELLSIGLFMELAKTKLLLDLPWFKKDRNGDFPYQLFSKQRNKKIEHL